MTDEFVMRKEGTIAVVDGQRSGSRRRSKPGIGRMGQAVHGDDRRAHDRRYAEKERRIPFRMSSMERIAGRTGSVFVGIFLIFIGMTLVVMGLTFLPIAGFVMALGAFGCSFFFLFARNRYGIGMLNKPKITPLS